jgi:hypothetical protein
MQDITFAGSRLGRTKYPATIDKNQVKSTRMIHWIWAVPFPVFGLGKNCRQTLKTQLRLKPNNHCCWEWNCLSTESSSLVPHFWTNLFLFLDAFPIHRHISACSLLVKKEPLASHLGFSISRILIILMESWNLFCSAYLLIAQTPCDHVHCMTWLLVISLHPWICCLHLNGV